MKRSMLVVIGMLAVASGLVPAHAAVNTVVAGPGAGEPTYRYVTDQVVVVTGAAATFVNADPLAQHDVVSDAKKNDKPIFKSGLIGVGTSEIVGLAGLTPDDYPFHCSVHPRMKGVITVVA